MQQLVGGDPEHNARIVHRVMSGETGPVRDIVVLNAAAGLVSFRLAEDPGEVQVPILDRFRAQMRIAEETIDSGAAASQLERWVAAASRS
jgi:anthranilate phosphoribosyltransferase